MPAKAMHKIAELIQTPMILTLKLKGQEKKNMIAQSVAPSSSKKVP